MRHFGRVWIVLAAIGVGCDLPPDKRAVDTNDSGGTRSPKDITIQLRRTLEVGDTFWAVENGHLENQTIAGNLFSKDVRFTLSAQSNGEQSISFRDYNGFVTIAARGMSWGRYIDGSPSGPFQEFPENTYVYHDRNNQNNLYYIHLGGGQDNLGRSDTIVSLSGGGTSLRVPLRELYLQRVRDIVARSKIDQWVGNGQARGFRCIEDSEGYPYVVNMVWGGGMAVEVWDPFLFQNDYLAKAERREIDPLSLKPLAAFDFNWEAAAGTTSTPVDFSSLRRRVYGLGGARDPLHFVSRGGKNWVLAGGLETPHRQAVAHLKKGWEHQNANRKDQAIPEYTKALEIDPGMANAYLNRALCSADNFYGAYSLQNIPTKVVRRMIDDFARAMDLEPARYRNADTISKHAMCLLATKNWVGAEADYTALIRMQPTNTAAYRDRRSVRHELGNTDGVAADDAEIARLEAEEKRKSEENRRESIRKAEEARRDLPDRLLVEAGLAKWPYEDSTYIHFLPASNQKIELLKRRLKDVSEKPIVIQLAGQQAESNTYKFDQLGFKLLKGKKVDSEEKIHLIIEAESDSSGEVKNGQGRVIESLGYGKSVMDRAYNTILILYVKNKLDWSSEKYSEIASYWDKAEQKVREKDEGAALEALDEVIRLDPDDKAAPTRKMELLEQSKNWAGIAAECTRILQGKPDDSDVRQRRLRAYDELKNVKGQVEDLGWLADNTKEDYYKKDYLSRKAHALARSGAWKEAADVLGTIIEKWPGESGFYDRRAECFVGIGEPERADQARAKSLELQRAIAAEAVSIQEGIATWAERSTAILVRPEFRARHALSSIRFRDPARVVIYYVGPPGLGGDLEKAGLQVETDRPARYDVALEVTNADFKFTLPGGQVLGAVRNSGSYGALAALRAYSARGRLAILGKAYEDLLPMYEDLLAALEAGDEAKELSLRQRVAEALPAHYDLQMELLLALQRAEEWPRVIELGTRIAAMEAASLDFYRKLSQPNYSIAIDPVEGGLKAAIAARLKLGQEKECLADADAWISRGTNREAALRQKLELLRGMGEFRAAAETSGVLALLLQKQATADYQTGYVINEYLNQSDLLKAAGDQAKSREVYRKAVMLTLKDPGPLSSRATERAKRGDFQGAMADINDAIERQGDKVQPWTYANRAQLRLMRGDTDGALQDYSAAIRLGDDADYHRQRAALFEKQGRTAEAGAERKRAWALPVSYSSAYSSRAQERAKAGDGAGALEDHAKGIELADDAGEKARRLAERAETRRLLKDMAGAIDDLGQAAETTKDRAETSRLYMVRAEVHLAAGDRAGGIQDLGASIEAAMDGRSRADLLEKRGWLKAAAGDSKGAIEDFSQAVGAEETWARVLRRASLYRRLGETSRAADDVKYALTLPFKPAECWSLAYALREAGAPLGVVVEVYDKALAMSSRAKRVGLLLNRAATRQSERDFSGAERDLEQAVQEFDRPDVRFARARFRRDRGNAEGMREDANAACALPLDRSSWSALTSRAVARLDFGDAEGAFKDLDEAVRRYPKETGVQSALADLQARAGRLDDALHSAEKAFESNKTDYSADRVYGYLLALHGRKDEGEKALENYPYHDSEWFWDQKAQVCLLAGDYEVAVKKYQAGIEKFPANAWLRARLAELRLEEGHLDDVKKAAELILLSNPQDSSALRLRALALARRGDPELERHLMELPSSLVATVRTELLLGTKKLEEALKAAEQELSASPRATGMRLLLAKILLAKGDRRAAGAQIKAGLELLSWDDGLSRWQFGQLSKKIQE